MPAFVLIIYIHHLLHRCKLICQQMFKLQVFDVSENKEVVKLASIVTSWLKKMLLNNPILKYFFFDRVGSRSYRFASIVLTI